MANARQRQAAGIAAQVVRLRNGHAEGRLSAARSVLSEAVNQSAVLSFSDHGPITLIHVDAHLDWRDEVNGAREGYSSTIRRASELKHIQSIFQIGIRGQGSARAEEVQAAQRYGSNIITARELHERGMKAVLDRIPDGTRYYLSIDADGLDPAVMPAVLAPQPGGMSYTDTIELIKGLCRKGQLVGMDIVEIAPALDLHDISSITAGHIILNAIGAAVRAGRCGP